MTCNQQVPSSTLGGGTNHFIDLQRPAGLILSRCWMFWGYQSFTALLDYGRMLRPWVRVFKHVFWLQLSWAKFQAKRVLFCGIKLNISPRKMGLWSSTLCARHTFSPLTSRQALNRFPIPLSHNPNSIFMLWPPNSKFQHACGFCWTVTLPLYSR